MKNDMIHLLVSFDQNYIKPFQTMIKSLSVSNPNEVFHICLLHSSISQEQLQELEAYCGAHRMILSPILIDRTFFEDAPVSRQYPQEMYYRLLAAQLLPDSLHRVLYLDPDILVINPLRPLWETDLKGHLFAASAHTGKTELANNINQFRLGTDHKYYNSGVLLIDLDRARKEIKADEIFRFVEEHGRELLLPDQDILNAMYGYRILEIDDSIWNYDARNFNNYLLRSAGLCDMDWVMQNTAILHFCGHSKPWQKGYMHRFGILYKHYERITQRNGSGH